MKHLLNDLSSEEKKSILEQHSGGKSIDTSKFKKLIESKLGNVKLLVEEETQETENATEQIQQISSELGSDIDPKVANEVMSCSFDEIGSGLNLKPEAKELLEKVKMKIRDMISKEDRSGLKTAFRQLKGRLQKAEPSETETNEQAGLTAAFVLLGISAPLWVWVAIGGIVLILLITAIVSLSSWIPKKKGRGCSRTITYRVR